MLKHIYADHAASTPVEPSVIEVMREAAGIFGNPSSIHSFGRSARAKLDQSRQAIADFLSCKFEEVIFTASGTESNNIAILGSAKANRAKGTHIITTAIEHPSVLNACRALEKDGFSVTYLPVGANGLVRVTDLENAIRPETVLISIHLANSEIGVIQDIRALSAVAKRHGVAFHTDACQAAAFIDLDVNNLGVDLLSFNGTKIYGPRGVAILFVREKHQIFPVVYGGGQEQSLRSGTENLPAIAGLAKAMEISLQRRKKDSEDIGKLRDILQEMLTKNGHAFIHVSESPRLPNHLSVCVKNPKSTNLVEAMDVLGVAVSAGSACSSKSLVESHVLTAIGLSPEIINKTLRITLGRGNTAADTLVIANAISRI